MERARREKKISQTPVDRYIADIKATPLLSRQEERDLAALVADGDPYARERMVKANLRLVIRIAKDFMGKGLDLEDLIAEGNIGLVHAVEMFDGTMDTRFSTYASWWIKQAIRRGLAFQSPTVRLPDHLVQQLSKWRQMTAELTKSLGCPPAFGEVAAALQPKLSQKQRLILRQALPLQESARAHPTSDDEEDLFGLQADGKSLPPGQLAEDEDNLLLIQEALARLTPREREVIAMRFGLGDSSEMTLKEVGKVLGLTRERIRQIEEGALDQLFSILGTDVHRGTRRDNRGKRPTSKAQPVHDPIELRVVDDGQASIPIKKDKPRAANSKTSKGGARAKSGRRRCIDPCTCNRAQTPQEVEFGAVMVKESQRLGRPMTPAEILATATTQLGYVKPTQNGPRGAHANAVKQFACALAEYKKQAERPFPTWSEVLEVMTTLGYCKERQAY